MKLEEKFIMTPIETIMEEAVGACGVIGGGIETYPVSEYVFQSVFLKMTGAQEQKLKCICWYIASFDYTFRYQYLDRYKDLHTFSALGDKTAVYLLIMEFFKRNDGKRVMITSAEKDKMIRETAASIARIFGRSELKEWNKRQYQEFKLWATDIIQGEVANGKQLLAGNLKAVYDEMHQNRNRYAHNTLSYQQNLPSMKELVKGKESGNFYEWFFILTLLDKVFMNRFEGVKEVLEKNN